MTLQPPHPTAFSFIVKENAPFLQTRGPGNQIIQQCVICALCFNPPLLKFPPHPRGKVCPWRRQTSMAVAPTPPPLDSEYRTLVFALVSDLYSKRHQTFQLHSRHLHTDSVHHSLVPLRRNESHSKSTTRLLDDDYEEDISKLWSIHSVAGSLSNLGASFIMTCVYSGSASFASPTIPGGRDIVSRFAAAFSWEADAHCSITTVLHPWSSLTFFR